MGAGAAADRVRARATRLLAAVVGVLLVGMGLATTAGASPASVGRPVAVIVRADPGALARAGGSLPRLGGGSGAVCR
jgi:hypothetical protein